MFAQVNYQKASIAQYFQRERNNTWASHHNGIASLDLVYALSCIINMINE
jgi:hypothetical protein